VLQVRAGDDVRRAAVGLGLGQVHVLAVEVDQYELRQPVEVGVIGVGSQQLVVKLRERVGLAAAGVPEDADVASEDLVNVDPYGLGWFRRENSKLQLGSIGIADVMDGSNLMAAQDEALVVEQRQLPDATLEASLLDEPNEADLERPEHAV
jgi:hypothetical protein